MKSSQLTAIIVGCLCLSACNVGGNNSSDTQTVEVSNDYAKISIVASNCQTISANGTCTVQATYSAPNGSAALNSNLSIRLTNYTNNIGQCLPFSTTQNTCTFQITATSNTNTGQVSTATLYPAQTSSPELTFNVGGGIK